MNQWMIPEKIPDGTYIAVFRCVFEAGNSLTLAFRYSADNRAQLFLDGERISDGPERGAPEYWYYQNVRIPVNAGKHVLTARVICLDPDIRKRRCAYAQMTVRHGFWIDDPSGLLRNWDCRVADGIGFEIPFPDWGTFPRVKVGTAFDSKILAGEGGNWTPVRLVEDSRILHEPDLPPMRYEEIVPEQRAPNLFYFPVYVCAWGQYHFSGRGTVRIRWAETPYLDNEFDSSGLRGRKGKRDGSCIIGNYDVFEVDGELDRHECWWKAGHYVEIRTEGEVQYRARFFRTGYPYPDHQARTLLEKMAFETLQACSFETYMDCPYFEQLLYAGDSRLEALCTYKLFDDHRLPAKCLRMLSLSQREDGALNAQYPSCSDQKIPSFMVIWLLMLADYYDRHGDDPLVLELRPRAVKLMEYLSANTVDGLLKVPGWNFIDWCSEWKSGVPPHDDDGPDSVLNWLYAMALQRMADLDLLPGLRRKAEELTARIKTVFYNPEKHLYALDAGRKYYSEHPQVLAMLAAGDLSVVPGLRNEALTQCSIYFSYYYLLACSKFGLDDLVEKRLARWKNLQDEGLTTFPEEFENPRSDCHAWSSHILYFLLPEK